MKRKVVALTPLVTLLIIVLTVFKLEALRKADWRITLDQFIASYHTPSQETSVESVGRARRPWVFHPQMGVPVRDDWRWQTEQLPYPPIEMYCALLNQPRPLADAGQSTHDQQIVYIGYHSDTLWRVGWIIHMGPHAPFSEEDVQNLALIGCDIGSEISRAPGDE